MKIPALVAVVVAAMLGGLALIFTVMQSRSPEIEPISIPDSRFWEQKCA
ncbi:hypothetical protein [Noviherbaspirillum sp. ST9]